MVLAPSLQPPRDVEAREAGRSRRPATEGRPMIERPYDTATPASRSVAGSPSRRLGPNCVDRAPIAASERMGLGPVIRCQYQPPAADGSAEAVRLRRRRWGRPMRDMDAAEARAFLGSGARTAKVATASSTGKPLVAPVWFILDGDDLVFLTTATSAKGRHLHANPRAAVAVEDDSFPYAFVVARGSVTLDDEPPDRLGWATRIASRYVPDRADDFAARNDAPGEKLVRLHLERVFGQAELAL